MDPRSTQEVLFPAFLLGTPSHTHREQEQAVGDLGRAMSLNVQIQKNAEFAFAVGLHSEQFSIHYIFA